MASGLIYLPSGAADFKSPEVRPHLDSTSATVPDLF